MSRTVFLILILIALSLSRHQDRMTTFVDDFSRAAANSMLANIYGYEFNDSYDDPSFRSRKYTLYPSLTSAYLSLCSIFISHLFSLKYHFFVFIEISFSKINLIVCTCRGVRMDLKNLPLSNSSHNFKTPFAVKTHIYRF